MNFIKKIVIALLVIALLLGMAVYIPTQTLHTVVGEVMYVSRNSYTGGYNPKHEEYYVYIKPIGKTENEDWIFFNVDYETKMDSTFSSNIEDMPELAVGNKVEITFKRFEGTNGTYYTSYKAKSIHIAPLSAIESVENPDFDLKFNKNYLSNWNGQMADREGTVVHVAKVNAPEEGYIVYLDIDWFSLKRFWIDSNTIMDEDTLRKLETGETGYKVKIQGKDAYPFYNRDIVEGTAIFFADNN